MAKSIQVRTSAGVGSPWKEWWNQARTAEAKAAYLRPNGNSTGQTLIWPTLPTAPVLAISIDSTGTVTLTWPDVHLQCTYTVFLSTDGGSTYTDVTSTINGGVTPLPLHTVTASQSGFGDSVHLYYYIVATNLAGTAQSNIVDAWTKPVAPTLSVSISGTVATLSWTAPGGATSYNVGYKKSSDTAYTSAGSTTNTTMQISGLLTDTDYDFEVQAVDAAGSSAWSANTNNATIPATPTAAPAVQATAETQIKITITDPGGTYTGGIIYRGASSTGPWTNVGTFTPTALIQYDNTVTAATTYYYCFSLTNAAGESAKGPASGAVTTPLNAPAAPTLSSVSINSSTGAVSGSVIDNATNESSTYLYHGTSSPPGTLAQTWPGTSTEPNTLPISDSIGTPNQGQTWYFQAVASRTVNGTTKTAASSILSVTIPLNAPAAPSGVGVTPNGTNPTTALDISWTDNSGNETGFQVSRNGTVVATVGANVTSYTDTGLSENTSYSYSIKSYITAYGNTAYSAAATGSGSTDLSAPTTAPSLQASSTPSIAVTITDTGGYDATLYRSTDNTNFSSVHTFTGGSTTWTDTGVTAGQIYYYKYTYTGNNGATGYSPTANATPPVPAPTAPGAITVTPTGSGSFSWSFSDNSTNEQGFYVYASQTSGFTPGPGNLLFPVNSHTGTGTVSGSEPNNTLPTGTWYFKVAAYNSGGTSYSGQSSATIT